MTKSTLEILSKYDELRRRADALNFYLHVDRHCIEMRPGLLSCVPDGERATMQFDGMDAVESFLDGVEWQRRYAAGLGWDQRAAEGAWREERDRQRILDRLSREN